MFRLQKLWPAFIRTLIALLTLILAGGLYLALVPGALSTLVMLIPGMAAFPPAIPIPSPPADLPAPGPAPAGYRAFEGGYAGQTFSCGFLLDLEDGRRVALSAAHAVPRLASAAPADLHTPDGTRIATLSGQIAYGQTFFMNRFSLDYVVWGVAADAGPDVFLLPDRRSQPEAGERVWLYAQSDDGAGGSKRWAGAVMSVEPEAIWVQLDDSFHPGGLSGCPVVSQHTRRVLGMAVAGANRPPTTIGLNPIASLLEKARAALSP